ncbi:Cytochrome [Forsythia ovata]|uniref:Cytochrome n=1 Tax=Forsythia ovata TaxID=205694 RepID=A0ABD1WPJ5_9LAMI
MQDCFVNGFRNPKQSRVIINAWAIMRDPNAWWEPNKFLPDRSLESDIDLRGHDFQLVPFGSGRRSCPGLQLGLTVDQLVVEHFVHCFDWELPNGMLPGDLDVTEQYGIVQLEPSFEGDWLNDFSYIIYILMLYFLFGGL